jgi:hypothetical protein
MATPPLATMRWNWLSGASASCPLAAPTAPAVNGLDQVSESAWLRNIDAWYASDACQLRLAYDAETSSWSVTWSTGATSCEVLEKNEPPMRRVPSRTSWRALTR